MRAGYGGVVWLLNPPLGWNLAGDQRDASGGRDALFAQVDTPPSPAHPHCGGLLEHDTPRLGRCWGCWRHFPPCVFGFCKPWLGREGSETSPPPPPQLAEDAGAQWVFATPFQFCHHLLLLSPSSFLLTLLPSFKDERTPTGSPVPCYPPSQRLGVLHPSIFVQRPARGPCSEGGEGVPEQREVALSHQMTSVRRMLEAVASLPSGLIQT